MKDASDAMMGSDGAVCWVDEACDHWLSHADVVDAGVYICVQRSNRNSSKS